MAANSDSTLMNSDFSSPFFTMALSASTMWVCGVIGYAQITSGRHKATASAIAREPSTCLSIGQCLPLFPDEIERGPGRRDVAGRHLG